MSKFMKAMEGRPFNDAQSVVMGLWGAALNEEQQRLMAEFDMLDRDAVETALLANSGDDAVFIEQLHQLDAIARTTGIITGMNRAVEIYLSIFAP